MNDKTKRLIYQSNYRGSKEADLLLGDFARQNLPLMDESSLDLYEKFLTYPDSAIQGWIIHREPAPKEFGLIVAAVTDFSRKRD